MDLDEYPVDAWYNNCPRPPPSDAGLSAASSLSLHPLFHVAGTIVDHIHDYPTLICLAMTCKTFHSLIHNSRSKLPEAFLNLEREIPNDRSSSKDPGIIEKDDWHSDDCSPIREKRDRSEYEVPRSWQHRNLEFFDVYFCDHDILRQNRYQLRTLDWLPCYGCHRLKRRATAFFPDQTKRHFMLLGCSAFDRRCISCNIGEAWRFVGPARYLQDMPKGLSGYRLCCTGCRNVEWAVRRPRKGQEMRKLCSRCYENLLGEEKPEVVLRKEWSVFAGMPIEPGKPKIVENDVPVAVAVAEKGVHESMSTADYRSWCRFEVLDVEAG